MFVDTKLPGDFETVKRHLGDQLATLRTEIADVEGRLRPVNLAAFFSKPAEKARAELKDQLATLRTTETELVAALAELVEQDANARDTAAASRRRAWSDARAAEMRTAHSSLNGATLALEGAYRAFVTAAIQCAAASKAAHPSVHEQSELLPRRLLSAMARDMVANGVQMDGFLIRDAVDHWDAPPLATCISSMQRAIRDCR